MVNSILILSVCLVIAYCYIFIKRKFSYWAKRGVHYEKPSVFFGNLGSVVLQKLFTGDYVHNLYKSTSEPFIGIYGGFQPILVIRDPKLLYDVLVCDFSYFSDRGIYIDEENDPLSINLITAEGKKWRMTRHKISAGLTSSKIKAMFLNLDKVIQPYMAYLDGKAGKNEPFELRNLACCYTADFAASTIFGLEVNSIDDPNTPFKMACEKFIGSGIINAFRHFLFMLIPKLMVQLGFHFMNKDTERYFTELVNDIASYRKEESVHRNDLFQTLIDTEWQDPSMENGPKLTENYKRYPLLPVVSHSFGLLLATFDTSKTTITCCLLELVKHPDVQRKVHEEIDSVLKDSNEITFELLAEMKYLDAVVCETLRLHPPLQQQPRVCTKDYMLPGTNITIEKGTQILVPAIGLHMDGNYFPNPEKFNPNRFLSGLKKFEEMPYIPFGLGPHQCVGKKLGEIETKLFLSKILKRFEFYSDNIEDLKIVPSTKFTLLNVANDIFLKVKVR